MLQIQMAFYKEKIGKLSPTYVRVAGCLTYMVTEVNTNPASSRAEGVL